VRVGFIGDLAVDQRDESVGLGVGEEAFEIARAAAGAEAKRRERPRVMQERLRAGWIGVDRGAGDDVADVLERPGAVRRAAPVREVGVVDERRRRAGLGISGTSGAGDWGAGRRLVRVGRTIYPRGS